MLISSSGRVLLGFNITFVAICTILLGFRFWAARIIRRKVYLDDVFIVLAYIAIMIFDGFMFWSVPNGIGAHIQELNMDQLNIMFKVFAAGTLPWLFATVCVKLSILCLYLRIFSTHQFKYYGWTLIGTCVAYLAVFLPWMATNCIPFSQSWNPVPGGHCRDVYPQQLAAASLNAAIDTIIVVLPMPWLWNLQMKTRKKVFVTVMFGIGFSTVAITLWRIQVTVTSLVTDDYSYGLVKLALICNLEIWLGFIAANVPTFAPLATRHFKPLASTMYGSVRSWSLKRSTSKRTSDTSDLEKAPSSQGSERQYLDAKPAVFSQREMANGTNSDSNSEITRCNSDTTDLENAIQVKREFEVEVFDGPHSNPRDSRPW